MKVLLKNGNVFTRNGFRQQDVFSNDGMLFVSDPSGSAPNNAGSSRIEDLSNGASDNFKYDKVIDCNNMYIVPGFVDVHVHLREPGFFYKETILTGTKAAAHGGYTCVCTMPNLDPSPTTLENLKPQLDLIEKDACVKVIPYGRITQTVPAMAGLSGSGGARATTTTNVLADMEDMAPYVIGFSDDGKGVQTGALMEDAMVEARRLGKPIVAHCEDEALLFGGYIHNGHYAREHGHKGICSESEWGQVERDLALAEKTGVQYHICHVSTKETVDLVRRAKARGVNVTCETAPHYLVFSEEDLQEDGRFKMNPPLRSLADKAALIEGIKDGTIDVIATDHAPHSAEEKSRGLAGSAFGIVGLETAFPILYTNLVETGIISFVKLINLMCVAPRRIFGLDALGTGGSADQCISAEADNVNCGYIADGQPADLTVLDLKACGVIDPAKFFSKGKSTPFEGMETRGEAALTMVDGEIAWER